MLGAPEVANATDTRPTHDGREALPEHLQRLQVELKFARTTIAALNFEIARLKRWRFGSSSESLEASTQAVLFDQIVADTAVEDRAAEDEIEPPPATPRIKRQAVRQALPASLPRIEHHHELANTVCECGQPLKRIGQEVSEQLDCEPTKFLVLRHIRGKYACACCQTIPKPRRCPHRSSTRASRLQACWPRS